jgi:glycosyltransferase involved in cell wall biosynthesis
MIENKILISVVMSVYNAEQYLDEAILSILNQTYSNFEFIIINDGSTDNSLKIIEKYIDNDKRIILISRENKGLIYSLNEGIDRAKGKYIARMDADDISLKNRFKEQINFMEKHSEIGACGTWIEIFGSNRKPKIWKLAINSEMLYTGLLFSVPMAHPSSMIRKSILTKYKLQYNKNFKNAEDYKLWIDMSQYTKYANIPKVLFRYRYLHTSISRVADKNIDDTRYKILSNSFTPLIQALNMDNTLEENLIHFTLMKNERIRNTSYHVNTLEQYLLKLIDANKEVKIYNDIVLLRILGKKYITILFLKKNINFLLWNYKLLFYGLVEFIFKGRF